MGCASGRAGADGVELWGGIECTVNRVGDDYHSQLQCSGHAERLTDLDLVAELGLRTLRYPLLWESTAPEGIASADWRWGDERLGRLRELGVRPIVGLVHHGSGPRHTSLVDTSFATGLAEYAGAVARRYPWVEDYTPVNEPMTTARFSCLYGHWYPHRRDERSMLRALVNQCRGTVLAMRAIRSVNPAARLVQTDDLGRVFSTPAIRYQADYENERRWLGWDVLCGRVTPAHPLHDRLLRCVRREDLDWFVEHPCPPDVIGVNHYLTSDRFLHERTELFPPHTRGGNGRDAYADVEAVRVLDPPSDGLAPLLREAWARYGLPLAVTEAHLGCSREEQLRWLHEIWTIAAAARDEGVDVRAVTVWALFGSYDWNSLLTRFDGDYEPGAFDLRGAGPRPTALAALIRELAAGREPDLCGLLSGPGWWRRPDRLLHALSEEPRSCGAAVVAEAVASGGALRPTLRRARLGPPLLITGATGTLGRAFGRLCDERGLPYRLLTRGELDICDRDSVQRLLADVQPWALVNTAGYVRVDEAEREPDRCWRENAEGPGLLAAHCAATGIRLLTFSSDLVFDGVRSSPYVESDAVHPLNVYGASKAHAEDAVLAADPQALVVRTSAFFGPRDPHSFLTIALRELAAGRRFAAANDAIVSPTYVPDLVNACLDLLVDGEHGLWHLANAGSVSWAEFALAGARRAGVSTASLELRAASEIGWVAARPAYSVLGSERADLLPSLPDAIDRFVDRYLIDAA